MNTFKSLENLQVSEKCFESIRVLIEEYLNERKIDGWKPLRKRTPLSHTIVRYGTEKPDDSLQLKIDFDTEPNEGNDGKEDNENK